MTRVHGKALAATARMRRSRRPLLASSAAIALVAFGGVARAQPAATPSYLGTVQSSVNAAVTSPADGRTNIRITNGATNAIVDWAPPAVTPAVGNTPAQIIFQQAATPQGNPSRAVVTSDQGQAYTLLNRINGPVGVPVLLNGVTTSYVGPELTAAGAPGQIGGSVWFYSPGGLIVGANGAFNVGSLLLTSNQIAVGGTASAPTFIDGTGKISFTGVADPASSVVIRRGAQLNLAQAGAYLAVVAPRVTMDGTATVNGSVAYVAGEVVDITMHDQLFDIAVSQGSDGTTTDPVTLRHTGSTSGPQPGFGENRAIYMVAVPKNNAVTMLVSGAAGYQGDATSAFQQNGIVVLSAGGNVRTSTESGYGVATAFFDTPTTARPGASIDIEGGLFNSRIVGNATLDVTASTAPSDIIQSNDLRFNGNTSLTARRNLTFTAGAGRTLAAGGSLTLIGVGAPAGLAVLNPAVSLDAAGGTVTIAGTLGMTATAINSDTTLVHVGASQQGIVTVTGNSALDTSGSSDSRPAVRGGTTEVVVNLGQVRFNGGLTAFAGANSNVDGATATGGTVSLSATNGSISAPFTTLSSEAFAGAGALGTGGTIAVSVGGTATLPTGFERRISLGSFATIYVTGRGGNDGGAGKGGTITIGAASGTIDGSSIQVNANGVGGRGTAPSGSTASDGGTGGRGEGGNITVTLNGGSTDFDSLNLDVGGFGGAGGAADSGYGLLLERGGGNGGAAQGGTLLVDVSGGVLDATSLNVGADGQGGNATGSYGGVAGTGGVGTGGTAIVQVTATAGSITGSTIAISAKGFGGAGGFGIGVPAGTGGRAEGGTARLIAAGGGSVTASFGSVAADAIGGGFDGGEGQGQAGTSGSALAGTAEAIFRTAGRGQFDNLIVEAKGLAGGPRIGGTANLTLTGGTLGITSQLSVDSSSEEQIPTDQPVTIPSAPTPTGPHDAKGGTSTLTVAAGSTLTLDSAASLTVRANATSGSDADGIVSGLAVGGTARVRIVDATQTIPNALNITANAVSGDAITPGAAYGGTAALELVGGAGLTVTGLTTVAATGLTGNGSVAGNAYGGSAGVLVDASRLTANGNLSVLATGTGNDSFDTGAASNGSGGNAGLTLAGAATVDTPQLTLNAAGNGGRNLVRNSNGTPTRGIAGNAQGGNVTLSAPSGRITVTGTTTLNAGGSGGNNATSGIAGDAAGGSIGVTSGSAILALQTLDIDAGGVGGQVLPDGYGAGGDGGDGRGGTINVALGSGGAVATSLTLNARGSGQSGGSVSPGASGGPYNGGAGGAAIGGQASLTTGGLLQATNLTIQAGAIAGAGGNATTGAVGRGGDANASAAIAEVGTTGTTGRIGVSQLAIDAGATAGGVGTTSGAGTNGVGIAGNALAGAARLTGGNATGAITATTLQINAGATAGSGGGTSAATGNGGAATGGLAQLAGAGTFTFGTLTFDAHGTGGNAGTGGNGGAGMAGTVAIVTNGGGTVDVTQSVSLLTGGKGGNGGVAGGAGRGGNVTLSTQGPGSRITIVPAVALDGSGLGGTPGIGAGGAGAGGAIQILAANGTINLATGSTLVSNGSGAAASGTGAGGAGAAGSITLAAANGGLITTPGALTLSATGKGEAGGTGASGAGGAISLQATSGRIAIGGALSLNAAGQGGAARAGDAGAASGGAVSIALASSDPQLTTSIGATSLTINSTATGGSALASATAPTNGRSGGAAAGGNVTIAVASGSLGTGATQINVTGTGGNAFGGAIGQAGTGGLGTGGNVTITTAAAAQGAPAPTIDFAGLTISAAGFGGGAVDTGYGLPAEGADGGSGQGGMVLIASGGGRITAGNLVASAQGMGRDGQLSNAAIGGGNGGAGTAGSVTLRGDGGEFTTSLITATLTGLGGTGAVGSSGGLGGEARGGTFTLAANGAGTPGFGRVSADAGATGGSGAAGRSGAGGAGGDAQGGTIAFTASGAGATLAVPFQLGLNVDATGGNGGAGGNSTRGGAGGNGGAATGGTIRVAAANGGTVTLIGDGAALRTVSAGATGGNGARGGNGSDFGDAGGVGGNGGVGRGGRFEVAADGGTVRFGDTDISAIGTGGNSAFGGSGTTRPAVPGTPGDPTANPPVPPTAPVPAIPAVQAASGNAGFGYGGTVSIRASHVDGQPAGSVEFATTNITATGNGGRAPENFVVSGIAGRVEILNDRSIADGGAITFGDVSVQASGAAEATSGLNILAGRGNVAFTSFDADVGGAATLRGIETGIISATNDFNLRADNAITVSHDRDTAATSDTLRADRIFLQTFGILNAQPGSVLRALDRMELSAGDSVFADALYAENRIDIDASFNVDLRTAIVNAPAGLSEGLFGGTIDIVAGQQFDDGAPLNAGSTNVTGRLFASASTRLLAGRDIVVNGGGSVESSNLVRLDAGNDIVVAAGGQVRGALDPVAENEPDFESSVGIAGLALTAGQLVLNYTPEAGNVASLRIAGTLSSGLRATSITAQAVQADATPLTARSLIVSITGAPTNGNQSNDNGALRGDCVQGNVCLGAIRTTRTLLIGGLTGTDVLPTSVSFAGGLNNVQTVVRAYGPISLAGGTTYGGSDLLRLQSFNGAITLGGGAVVTGGQGGGQFGGLFDILAAGGIAGAGATLASDGDVRLHTGTGDLTLGTLSAAGRLVTLAADGTIATSGALEVAGNVTIGDLLSVRGGDAVVNAGGGIVVGTAEVSNGDAILFTADGLVDLGLAQGAGGGTAGTVALQGASVRVDEARASGNISLVSTGGGILASTLTAGQRIDVLSAGDANLGFAQAGTIFYVDAEGFASANSIRAGYIRAEAASIDFGGIAAAGDIALYATNAIQVDSSDAGQDFYATGGNVDLGAVNARGLAYDGGEGGGQQPGRDGFGDIVVDSAGQILLAQGNAAGLIRLTAQSGSISTGALTARETVNLNAIAGSVTLGATEAGGSVTATAGDGNVTGSTIRAGIAAVTSAIANPAADILAVATGAIRFDRLTAGRNINLSGGGAVLVRDDIVAGGLVTARGASVTLNGENLLAIDNAAATGGDLVLNGGDVRLRTASATGNLTIDADRTIDVATALDIGGGIDLDAADAIATRGLRAGLSIAAASANGTLATQDIESVGGIVRLTAGGNLTAGNVRAAGSIFVTGKAAITAGNLTAGTGPLAAGAGGGAAGVDPSVGGIAAGFDGFAIEPCDDECNVQAFDLPFTVNYFGRSYSSTYVGNNGYITFGEVQTTYTPEGLGVGYAGLPIIAAFFADVDTRNPGSRQVTYGSGTFAGRQAFGATYENVGYYNTRADNLNSFQIILTNRADTGTGNFDIYYNYSGIRWETGEADGGINGFGGVSAAVGYNAGIGNQAGSFFELPGSRIPGSFLDGGTAPLIATTNNGIAGQLLFSVRNGQVIAPIAIEPPTVHVTNVAAGNTAAITIGNVSGEAAEIHGAGAVRVGDINVGDRGSGIAGTGNRYATVVDAAGPINAGNITGTGYVVLGSGNADIMAGNVITASSATVLASGAVVLGTVTTGRGADDALFVSNASILGTSALDGFTYAGLLTRTAFGPASFTALTPVRLGGTLTIGGALSTGNLIAAAMQIDLGTQTIDAANRIYLDSTAALVATTLTAGGDVTLNSDGTLTIGSATAGATLRGMSLGTLIATSVSGRTGVALTATGALGVDSATSATGDVALSGGTIRIGRANAGRDIVLTAGTLAGNEGTHATTASNLTAARNITASIDGTLALTTASAGGTLLAETTRDLTADAVTAVGAVALRSRANLIVGSAAATGTAGAVTLASGAPATATGAYSQAGNTIVNGTVTGGQSVTINGGGNVTVNGQVRAPTLTMASGNDITVAQTGSVGTGTNAVALTAGSLRAGTGTAPARIVATGTIDGATITLASTLIDIGAAAQIGSAATGTLAFMNNGGSRTFLGGTTPAGGDQATYTISNAEFARVRGNTIRIVAPAVTTDGSADVVLSRLDLIGSAGTGTTNLVGTNASFTVQTAGSIRVDDAVGLTSAAATDTLSLAATRRIDVNAGAGSLAVTNANALAGRLSIAADSIFAGTTTAAADLANATTIDARDQRLGVADVSRPDGYLRANAIEFRFGSGLFVQNSGTVGDTQSTTRAGFAAGAGGVTLTSTAAGTVTPAVIINGRITDNGNIVTGSSVIPRLVIRGVQTQNAALDPRSTVNGCLIVGQSCRFDAGDPTPIPIDDGFFPVQDTIREALEPRAGEGDPTEGGVTRVNAPLIDLPDFIGYGLQSTIDEPVTGAGNDDLLVGDEAGACPPGATDPRCNGSAPAPSTRP